MTDCHYFLLCKKNVSWHILAPGACDDLHLLANVPFFIGSSIGIFYEKSAVSQPIFYDTAPGCTCTICS